MVYKRYIKRGDKLFGPYYYESYRDENGIPRNRKVDSPKKNKFSVKLFYVLIAFSLILIVGLFILSNNLEKKSSINLEKISFGPKILGSFIKLIGFGVEDENVKEQQEIPEENTENTPEIIEEPIEIIENPPEIIEETTPESQEQTTQEINQTEISPEINQTEIITENNSQTPENTTIVNESVTAQTSGRNISANISIINQTETNFSENITQIQKNNFTINEKAIKT